MRTTLAKGILRYFYVLETAAAAFVYIFYTLSATRVLNSFEELCIALAAAGICVCVYVWRLYVSLCTPFFLSVLLSYFFPSFHSFEEDDRRLNYVSTQHLSKTSCLTKARKISLPYYSLTGRRERSNGFMLFPKVLRLVHFI